MISRSPYHKTRTSFYSYSPSIIGCSFSHIYTSSFIMFNFDSLLLRLFLFIPSFIKIPPPPSSYWSPEVHCEVNTSTSLFSAGPSSKLGVHGILRFIPNRLSLFIYFILSCLYCIPFYLVYLDFLVHYLIVFLLLCFFYYHASTYFFIFILYCE